MSTLSRLERALTATASLAIIYWLVARPLYRTIDDGSVSQLERQLEDLRSRHEPAGPQHVEGVSARAQDLVRCALQTDDPVKYVNANVRKETAEDAKVLNEALRMLGAKPK